MKKEPYQCPVCGYSTRQKSHIEYHFYRNKKPCPKSLDTIELTQEIKEYVLANRVYIKPLVDLTNPTIVNTTFVQTINNYNQMNNIIASIDPIEKLNKYVDQKHIDLLDFDESVQQKYCVKAKKLENNSYKHQFELKTQQLLEIFDEVSKVCDGRMEDFNLMYNEKGNKLQLYEGGEWQELLIMSGLKRIIGVIQSCYLNAYECYLLRLIYNNPTSAIHKQRCRELLVEYFKFIGSFDVVPFIKGKTNNQILYNDDDSKHHEYTSPCDIGGHSILDEYYPLYNKTRDRITKSEVNELKKSVVDIIKRNVMRNVEEMNKRVLELFNMDESFKQALIAKYSY